MYIARLEYLARVSLGRCLYRHLLLDTRYRHSEAAVFRIAVEVLSIDVACLSPIFNWLVSHDAPPKKGWGGEKDGHSEAKGVTSTSIVACVERSRKMLSDF